MLHLTPAGPSRKADVQEVAGDWEDGAKPTLRCRSLRAEADQMGPARYLACSIVAARPLLLGAAQDSLMSSALVDGTAHRQPRLRTEGERRMSRAERLGRPALSDTR